MSYNYDPGNGYEYVPAFDMEDYGDGDCDHLIPEIYFQGPHDLEPRRYENSGQISLEFYQDNGTQDYRRSSRAPPEQSPYQHMSGHLHPQQAERRQASPATDAYYDSNESTGGRLMPDSVRYIDGRLAHWVISEQRRIQAWEGARPPTIRSGEPSSQHHFLNVPHADDRHPTNGNGYSDNSSYESSKESSEESSLDGGHGSQRSLVAAQRSPSPDEDWVNVQQVRLEDEITVLMNETRGDVSYGPPSEDEHGRQGSPMASEPDSGPDDVYISNRPQPSHQCEQWHADRRDRYEPSTSTQARGQVRRRTAGRPSRRVRFED